MHTLSTAHVQWKAVVLVLCANHKNQTVIAISSDSVHHPCNMSCQLQISKSQSLQRFSQPSAMPQPPFDSPCMTIHFSKTIYRFDLEKLSTTTSRLSTTAPPCTHPATCYSVCRCIPQHNQILGLVCFGRIYFLLILRSGISHLLHQHSLVPQHSHAF